MGSFPSSGYEERVSSLRRFFRAELRKAEARAANAPHFESASERFETVEKPCITGLIDRLDLPVSAFPAPESFAAGVFAAIASFPSSVRDEDWQYPYKVALPAPVNAFLTCKEWDDLFEAFAPAGLSARALNSAFLLGDRGPDMFSLMRPFTTATYRSSFVPPPGSAGILETPAGRFLFSKFRAEGSSPEQAVTSALEALAPPVSRLPSL